MYTFFGFLKIDENPRYIIPNLRVAGSNPAGVANKINALVSILDL
jgi:hypothetical protein